MPDIQFELTIQAPPNVVFRAVSTEVGLNAWWTLSSSAEPSVPGTYGLHFGPEYDWRARVARFEANSRITFVFTDADLDWIDTWVDIRLVKDGDATTVLFTHGGWRSPDTHFRNSAYCWALYLRLLRRYVERGEVVPYEDRYDA